MKGPASKTRLLVDKTNSRILAIIIVAVFVTVFCLVSSKALLSQAAYQRRLLGARRTTLTQLINNKSAAHTLVDQFTNVFQGNSPTNVLGGKNVTDANPVPPDGDNARIVLDSLPTTYDFPALISSVEKILSNNSISSPQINGTDQSAAANNKPSDNPKPVTIDLTVAGQGSYDHIRKLIDDFERSTRPFDITSLQITGSNNFMSFQMNLHTYYQQAKTLGIGQKVVK